MPNNTSSTPFLGLTIPATGQNDWEPYANGNWSLLDSLAQSQALKGAIALSLSGNTSGTLALISSGTIVLAGGNNITLSQNGSRVSIVGGAGGGGGVAIAADGSTYTSGTVLLSGGNNVTLSKNGQTITISVGPQSIQTQGSVLINGSSGSIVIAGGNNVTLSQNASSITIHAASQSVQTQNSLRINGSSGSVVITGGSNVTLSQNASTITINAASQSVQTQNSLLINGSSGSVVVAAGNNVTLSQNASSITIHAASQSIQTQGSVAVNGSSGSIVLVGGNNITLSQNASTITISAASQSSQSQSVQTQNVVDLSLSGNTSGTLTLISSGTAVLAGGNNITLSQAGQSITISAANTIAQSVQTQGTMKLNGSGGDLSLIAGANISLSQNASSITISASNQSVQTQNLLDVSLAGNTSGTLALASSGTLILAGGNNITLSQVGNAVTISAAPSGGAQSEQTQNLFDLTLSGNTTGTLALISSGTLSLAGGNNIILSQSGNKITISASNAPAQTVQTQNLCDVSLSGNTSGTLALVSSGTLVLAGGNNIVLSQVGQSVTISASNAPAQSVQTQNLIDASLAGNTTGTLALISSGTLILAGGNNVTLSQNGQSVTISAANTIAQTVQTQNLLDASLSGNTSGTLALISSGTMILAGGNNITLSQVGQSVTISAPNAIAQSVQTQNLFDLSLSGNTSGTLALISSGTGILAGGNNITLSQVGQSVTISAASQSVQTQNMIDVSLSGNTSGTLTLISSGTMILAGGANVRLSQDGQSITISAAQGQETIGMSNLGNTSGTTGVVTGSNLAFAFAGGNNITLSQSINGSSGTITISAASQTVQTQNLCDLTVGGNSTSAGAGFALISSGTALLAGGNNVTLSQNGNSITISGPNTVAQSVQTQNCVDLSLSGNSTSAGAGFVLISSGTAILAGGNNVTLSQNGQSVTISAASQSVQTQNLVDLTLAGNSTSAGGGFALISSGTLTLAGGNNITLSQNANAVTISAASQSVQTQSLGSDTIGMSNIGNTSGTTGVVSGSNIQFVLAGGNNITLSQSVNGSSATISISAFTQTVQTQNLLDLTVGGNSTSAGAGFVLMSSGTLTLAGGNNITLSQNGNALTISAANSAAQTVQTQNLIDVTLAGNSTSAGGGFALISSGTLTLAGGNNITLSQNANAVTISAASQSAQSQSNIQAVVPLGNTTGTTGSIQTGTLGLAGGSNITLSQSSGTASTNITIIGASQSVQTQNLMDVTLAGNSTSAGAGFVLVSSGTLTLAGGNNVTLSQNGNAVTISAANSIAQSVQTQNCVDLSLSGNSTSAGAGFALISSGTGILAGGNNITLSQNGQSVTISAFNQTVQTQNLVDLTIGGNSTSAGAGYALISSGTALLAGGNNITLSQNGNSITISAGAGGAGSNTLGMSNIGNTSGTTGVISGSALQLAFAGGNNVTLSQSVNASSATITISAAAQTVQTQNLVDVSVGGNSTSAGGGFALISSGTMLLAGGNNVTLSQNGQSITISAFTQSVQTQSLGTVTAGMSNLGNTSGTTGVITGTNVQFLLAGGNNVTLSQSINGASGTITISAFTQTVQTQNMFDLTIGGNSTSAGGGFALISSGTALLAGGNNVTLSQNAQSLTISANGFAFAVTGGNSTSAGAGFSTIVSGTLSIAGSNNLTLSQNGQSITFINAAAAISLSGNSTSAGGGYSLVSSGTAILAGGNNITLSQNGASITVSAGRPKVSYWNNFGAGSGAQIQTANLSGSTRSLFVFPLNPAIDGWPGDMTASTARMLLSVSGSTASMSQQHSIGFTLGIYTVSASSTLNLLNSVGSSWTQTTLNTSDASNSYAGIRWLSFHSSQWSSNPVFVDGSMYIAALLFSWSSISFNSMAFFGGSIMNTLNASGTFNAASVTNTSAGFIPFGGIYTATTAALPATININQLNKQVAGANFVPLLEFDNLVSAH